MADGKISLPYKQFLGYEKGEDGLPKIVESEAEIVRQIFRLYIDGRTPSAIARQLVAEGIPSPGGKKTWQVATVKSILSNEKYKGDALLQKRFTVDFLTKKIKVNEGEVPQYYVQNSHPAIIDPDEFDAVQAEIERQKKIGRPSACQSPLSTKLVCGTCGGFYGPKVWGSNTKYRRVIWQCNDKYKGDSICPSPFVKEEDVKQKFLEAFNSLLEYREELIINCRLAQDVLCDCSGINTELCELHQELEVVTDLARKSFYEHAPDSEYEWNNRYKERHNKAVERIAELDFMKREKQHKKIMLGSFIQNIKSQGNTLDEFDERLWMATIKRVVITPSGGMAFQFKDGSEICL